MSPAGGRATIGSRFHFAYGACGGSGGGISKEAEPIIERKRVRPSETYLAGFGGSTFGGKINGLEGTGPLSGFNRDDRDLADSGIYGAKLGHFFGNRMDWLGVEIEGFNASPHVEQQGPVPGAICA